MDLTKTQIEEFKRKLNSTLVEIQSELNEITDEKGEVKVPDFGSDVESTEDFPEEADEAEEFSTNIAISAGLKERLRNIESALRKIEDGSYGKCEHCGKNIPLEVLDADPESLWCKDCKNARK